MESLLLILLVPAIVALVLVPVSIRVALVYGIVDRPDSGRKLHARITPYLGGLIVYGGFLSGILLSSMVLQITLPLLPLTGLTLLFLIGLLDDMWDMSAVKKLFFQIVSILLIIHLQTIPFTLEALPLLGILIIVGVLVINAMNLIDGMDGLAAGQVLVITPALFVYALLQGRYDLLPIMVVFSIAVSVFSFVNSNPAKIFLGDAGSLFQGGFLFWMVADLTMGTPRESFSYIPLAVVMLSLPIVDVFAVIVQRLWAHQGIMKADRRHMHHHLGRCQMQSSTVVHIMNSIVSLYSVLWIFAFVLDKPYLPLILMPLMWIIFYALVFHCERSKSNRKF